MLLRKDQHLELKVKNWGGDDTIFLMALSMKPLIIPSQQRCCLTTLHYLDIITSKRHKEIIPSL